MNQPLTPPQIAEIKYLAGSCMYYGTDWANNTILSLIATLEARDAAFDEMLKALKELRRLYDWRNELSEQQKANPEIDQKKALWAYGVQKKLAWGDCSSAIAHAEKVK